MNTKGEEGHKYYWNVNTKGKEEHTYFWNVNTKGEEGTHTNGT